MNRRESLRHLLTTLAVAPALTACGGGSTDATSPVPSTPPAPAPTPAPGPAAPAPTQPPAGGESGPATGLAWYAGTAIPTTAAAMKLFPPAVGVSPSGRAHLLWIQHEGLSPVVGKLYTASAHLDDGRWSAPMLLAEAAASNLSGADSRFGLGSFPNNMAMLPLGSSGDMLAIWSTGPFSSLTMRRYNANTAQWDQPEALAGELSTRLCTASSTQGHVAISWSTRNGTQILVIDAQGQQRRYSLAIYGGIDKIVINAQGKLAATWWNTGRQMLAVTDSPSWSEPIQLPGIAKTGLPWTDLQINEDGEVAVAWTLESLEIASLVLRADGRYELPAAVRALRSSSVPSLLHDAGGWHMAFIASHHSPDWFFIGSLAMNAPYYTTHRWGSGWNSPQAIPTTGPADAGHAELLRTATDEITALVSGHNQSGYSLKKSATSWSPASIAKTGLRPSVAARGVNGQAVVVWSDDKSLHTHFRR